MATEYCPEEVVERRVFIKRHQPYSPSPTGQIPLDAKYELPTEYCKEHDSAPVVTIPEEFENGEHHNGLDDDDKHKNDDEYREPNGNGNNQDNWFENWFNGNKSARILMLKTPFGLCQKVFFISNIFGCAAFNKLRRIYNFYAVGL